MIGRRRVRHHIHEHLVGNLSLHPVQFQERDRRGCPDAFLPIEKWMVLHEMKEIGRSHFEQFAVKVVPAES